LRGQTGEVTVELHERKLDLGTKVDRLCIASGEEALDVRCRAGPDLGHDWYAGVEQRAGSAKNVCLVAADIHPHQADLVRAQSFACDDLVECHGGHLEAFLAGLRPPDLVAAGLRGRKAEDDLSTRGRAGGLVDGYSTVEAVEGEVRAQDSGVSTLRLERDCALEVVESRQRRSADVRADIDEDAAGVDPLARASEDTELLLAARLEEGGARRVVGGRNEKREPFCLDRDVIRVTGGAPEKPPSAIQLALAEATKPSSEHEGHRIPRELA